MDITQSLWLLLTNPNISYLLLVIGIWCVVLAVSIPGTGLPEAAAVVSLALAAIGLLQVPLNLVGLALIGVALVMFTVEFRVQSHGALLLGGALALAVGATLLYRNEDRSAAQLSWLTLVGAPVVTTLVFGYVISRGLAAMRLPTIQDLRRLIGTEGVTRTEVEREGTVYADGELWSATAGQRIPANTRVVVVDRKGLVLTVAPLPAPASAPPAPPAGANVSR